MRRICITLGAAALLVVGITSVNAGDFHRNASLVCSDCHTMHFSQQHGHGCRIDFHTHSSGRLK